MSLEGVAQFLSNAEPLLNDPELLGHTIDFLMSNKARYIPTGIGLITVSDELYRAKEAYEEGKKEGEKLRKGRKKRFRGERRKEGIFYEEVPFTAQALTPSETAEYLGIKRGFESRY